MASFITKQQKAYLYAIVSVAVIIVVWFFVVPPSYISSSEEDTSAEKGLFDMLKSEFSNIF